MNASNSDGRNITLRPMTADLAGVFGTSFAAIEPWSRYPFSPRALQTFLGSDEPDADRYSIFANDVAAGAVVICKRWLRGPYLQFLGILPDYQRTGLGGNILDWFEASARETAERNIWVAASEFNTGALSFYQQHGFERAARLDGLVADGIAEILLRKRI